MTKHNSYRIISVIERGHHFDDSFRRVSIAKYTYPSFLQVILLVKNLEKTYRTSLSLSYLRFIKVIAVIYIYRCTKSNILG
jgi:hypothetical protein